MSVSGRVARCAAAGKHVLLEKPLDATPEGARAVVSAMEAAGLTLGVVLQHRFRASVERLAGLMRDHLRAGGAILAATHGPLGLDARELRIGP